LHEAPVPTNITKTRYQLMSDLEIFDEVPIHPTKKLNTPRFFDALL
jgi:hypothetical protein